MLFWFFVAAVFSESLGTIAGFGSSTIFLPIAVHFYDFKTALVLVAIMHIFGNLGRISFFKRGLDTRVLLRFGVPSVIFTLSGALLVTHVDQATLKAILGVFLVGYALFAYGEAGIHIAPTLRNSLVGGSLSGFLAGLIGTGGALRGAFLTAFSLSKDKYIATAAAIALAVDATRIPVYFAEGFLGSAYYWYIPLLFISAIVGSLIGKRLVRSIPQARFRQVVLLAITIVGLKFIFDWLPTLLV
jgi:hypothetical protein